MKAVVVGGSGFLGLNIIEALAAEGHEVVATRRRSSNTIFLRRLKVPMAVASLEDPGSMETAFAGADVVFFAAGHYPRLSFDTTAQVEQATSGARNLLSAAQSAGVRRVVYTGSVITVAGPNEDRPARESDGTATAPLGSTYFAVKLALEREVLAPPRGPRDHRFVPHRLPRPIRPQGGHRIFHRGAGQPKPERVHRRPHQRRRRPRRCQGARASRPHR
ncbi:NAD-dependent epimerase/dehydratase family protein [Myxococcota bacterium]